MRPSFWLGTALFCASASAQTVPPTLELPIVDAPGATWIPAATGNFAPANRPVDEPIDRIVIHDIEGTAAAGISIFGRVGAKVSAHYIVGGDGQIFQLVRERDIAWHAGNSAINHRAVGIELEGFAYRPGFFNPIELEAAAKLVRDVTTRYAIPRDRQHIIGHAEVPNPNDPTRFGGISGHTDPGPYWNWNAFMALVRNDSRLISAEIPLTIRPGETLRVAITLQNSGDDAWAANLARDPRNGLQANTPVAYLGSADGKISRFSSLSGWISPIFAAGTATDTLPGTSARFEFSLRGPRELGEVNESLRLSLQPTAAQNQMPTYFGESVPVSLRVVPWNIDATPNLASWSAKLPLGGWWAIYVSPPKSRSKTPFRYAVKSGGEVKTFEIPAKMGGRGMAFAGWISVADAARDSAVEIELQGATQKAGGVRLMGPFPGAVESR